MSEKRLTSQSVNRRGAVSSLSRSASVVVPFDQPECLGARAYLLCDSVHSSSNTSQSRLVKTRGRMKSLNFGASCAARMLHAALQIHDSSDLSPLPVAFAR